MDDLNERLDRLLSDPAAMAKMQAMLASMTGGAGDSAPPASSPPPPPATTPPPALPPLPQTDDTALLKALRPYLHGEREKKLDEAIKLLELSRLLPLLRS